MGQCPLEHLGMSILRVPPLYGWSKGKPKGKNHEETHTFGCVNFNRGPFGHQDSLGIHVHQPLMRHRIKGSQPLRLVSRETPPKSVVSCGCPFLYRGVYFDKHSHGYVSKDGTTPIEVVFVSA